MQIKMKTKRQIENKIIQLERSHQGDDKFKRISRSPRTSCKIMALEWVLGNVEQL